MLQTFLFDQTDYLGEVINEAHRLQQLAWNEIVISGEVQKRISVKDDVCARVVLHGRRMADRGFRVDPHPGRP